MYLHIVSLNEAVLFQPWESAICQSIFSVYLIINYWARVKVVRWLFKEAKIPDINSIIPSTCISKHTKHVSQVIWLICKHCFPLCIHVIPAFISAVVSYTIEVGAGNCSVFVSSISDKDDIILWQYKIHLIRFMLNVMCHIYLVYVSLGIHSLNQLWTLYFCYSYIRNSSFTNI